MNNSSNSSSSKWIENLTTFTSTCLLLFTEFHLQQGYFTMCYDLIHLFHYHEDTHTDTSSQKAAILLFPDVLKRHICWEFHCLLLWAELNILGIVTESLQTSSYKTFKYDGEGRQLFSSTEDNRQQHTACWYVQYRLHQKCKHPYGSHVYLIC